MQHPDCIHFTKLNTTLNTQYAMQHKCNATQIHCNTNGPSVIRFADFFKENLLNALKRHLYIVGI